MPEATLTAPAPSVGTSGAAPSSSPAPVATPSTGGEPDDGALVDTGAATPTPEGDQTGATSDTDPSAGGETDGDGRLLPRYIRELKTTNPEDYKRAKAEFFGHSAYRQVFPTVGDARQAKQTLELVGGEAGLATLQQDMSEFREVAGQYVNGDPKFVDDLAQNDPIAFGTHAPRYLDKLREVDALAFNRLIAKQFVSEFAATGFRAQLEQAYAATQDPKVRGVLNQLAKWHDDVEQLSKQEDDPRYKKLQEELRAERAGNSEKGYKEFYSGYQTDARKGIDGAATKLLDSYLKGQTVDPEDMALLRRNAIQIANEVISKDDTFTKQRNLLLQRQDKEAAVRYAVARFEQALGDPQSGSVKRVIKAFGRTGAKPAVAAQPSQQTAKPAAPQIEGFTRIKDRPNPMDIDSQRSKGLVLNQRAILKDGRKVTWATA